MRGNLRYLCGPEASAEQAREIAAANNVNAPFLLQKRDVVLGWVALGSGSEQTSDEAIAQAWQASQPALVTGIARDALSNHARHFRAAANLVEDVLACEDLAELLSKPPYEKRLGAKFELLSAFHDEGDPQEIITVEFDGLENKDTVAENLWVKASWLSFLDDDNSLRFRFSFGIVDLDDVSQDFTRQTWAAALTEAVFPESALITKNAALDAILRNTIGIAEPAFVETIVYFNAPNGGACFHQDVERGHLGVVFAQATGSTAWLTLSKVELIRELQGHLANGDACAGLDGGDKLREALRPVLDNLANATYIDKLLDSHPDNEALLELIDTDPRFTARLINNGYGYLLAPGDMILLPQQSLSCCAWHSVFCVGDETGEGLSFAIREAPAADE